MLKFLYVLVFIFLFTSSGWAKDVITVYSGAGMRKPMDKIGRAFEKKYGVSVRYNYAGSNTLLSQMELTKKGDCYMPGATMYIEKAKEKGFVDYEKPVAYHIPVIVVPEGNPANIKSLKDLIKPGVKVILGDPKAAACGKIAKKILEKNKIYDGVQKNVIATAATVNELVVYMCMGQADASIIWKASLLGTEDKTDIIEIPKKENMIKVIPIGRLTFSKHKKIAKRFVDFVASSEGKNIFKECGFTAYPSKKYGSSTGKKIMLYSGAELMETMNILGAKFEKEHGVKVVYNYAGAGHLLSQMEITQQGDIFIPGALFTFNKAKEKGFIEPGSERLVAYHIPVIGVKKDNPANITCLEDLARPGIKIVLGDPKVVPIGRAAEKILKDAGIRNKVNIVSRASEEPQLVIAVSEGIVDAAIFWRSSLWELRDRIDIIEIPKEQNCIKTIPIGVLTFSKDKDSAKDFCNYVVSRKGKKIWEENGYIVYPNPKYKK